MLGVTVNIFDWRKFVMYKSMKILIGKKFYRTASRLRTSWMCFSPAIA